MVTRLEGLAEKEEEKKERYPEMRKLLPQSWAEPPAAFGAGGY